LDDSLGSWPHTSIKPKFKSMKWSDTKELVLGSSSEPFVVLINRYKNRYGIVLLLVSRFGGWSWLRG
jgi:hypothetical protein